MSYYIIRLLLVSSHKFSLFCSKCPLFHCFNYSSDRKNFMLCIRSIILLGVCTTLRQLKTVKPQKEFLGWGHWDKSDIFWTSKGLVTPESYGIIIMCFHAHNKSIKDLETLKRDFWEEEGSIEGNLICTYTCKSLFAWCVHHALYAPWTMWYSSHDCYPERYSYSYMSCAWKHRAWCISCMRLDPLICKRLGSSDLAFP